MGGRWSREGRERWGLLFLRNPPALTGRAVHPAVFARFTKCVARLIDAHRRIGLDLTRRNPENSTPRRPVRPGVSPQSAVPERMDAPFQPLDVAALSADGPWGA